MQDSRSEGTTPHFPGVCDKIIGLHNHLSGGFSSVFLLLEGNDAIHIDRVLALVREEKETAVILRDGSVMATGFTPLTIARRSRRFLEKGKAEAERIRRGGSGQ
jgi:hypothetical protein